MKHTLFLFAALLFLPGCDSTKGHDFYGHDTPEPVLTTWKQIEVQGRHTAGTYLTFTVTAPPEFNYKKRWHFYAETGSDYHQFGDTVRRKFHAGNYKILVDLFNQPGTQIIHSNLLLLNIK